MTQKPKIAPQIVPVTLTQALEGCSPEAVLSTDVARNGQSITPADDLLVSGVSVDSSEMQPGWIFVGIPGANQHGARFAPAAVKNGAAVLVTDSAGVDVAGEIGVPIVVVEDPRLVAAKIAANIYGHALGKLRLSAVTGTNGKTTTTYLLRAALTGDEVGAGRLSVGLMGTLETAVSPTPVLASRTTAEAPVVYQALATAAQNGCWAAVVEASAHAMSLYRLEGLVFDSVIFTNLQHDHLDYYGDMENYFAAKAKLFAPDRARAGVVAIDDEWGRKLAREAQIPLLTVSALEQTPAEWAGSPTHWQVTSWANDPQRWGVSFVLVDPSGNEYDCFCPVPGSVNVQNAAVALLSATQMGVPLERAIAQLAQTPPIPGRMEIVPSDESRTARVLVDYAHTPEALTALLETIRPLVGGKLILVFGTDGDRDASKREELGRIAAEMADYLWVTDENPRTEDPEQVRAYLLRGISEVRPGLENVIEVKTCRRDAVREALLAAQPGDLVAITGKGAEPYQEVQGVKHAYSDTMVASETLASRV